MAKYEDLMPKDQADYLKKAIEEGRQINKAVDEKAKSEPKTSVSEYKSRYSGIGGGGMGRKKTPEYRKGGYVKSADGCAVRGKTKGKMV